MGVVASGAVSLLRSAFVAPDGGLLTLLISAVLCLNHAACLQVALHPFAQRAGAAMARCRAPRAFAWL